MYLTKGMNNIIIYKQNKFACLAQSVEHSAVNRSVGGSSPSTGAIRNNSTQMGGIVSYLQLSKRDSNGRKRQQSGELLPRPGVIAKAMYRCT